MPTSCACPEFAGAMRTPSGNVSLPCAGIARTNEATETAGAARRAGASTAFGAGTADSLAESSGTGASRSSHHDAHATGTTNDKAATHTVEARRFDTSGFRDGPGHRLGGARPGGAVAVAPRHRGRTLS